MIHILAAARHGYTAIKAGSYLAFAPDAERTAYITIYTEGGRIVCTNNEINQLTRAAVSRWTRMVTSAMSSMLAFGKKLS